MRKMLVEFAALVLLLWLLASLFDVVSDYVSAVRNGSPSPQAEKVIEEMKKK